MNERYFTIFFDSPKLLVISNELNSEEINFLNRKKEVSKEKTTPEKLKKLVLYY